MIASEEETLGEAEYAEAVERKVKRYALPCCTLHCFAFALQKRVSLRR